VSLGPVMPLIEILNDLQAARIVHAARNLVEPGAQAIGNAVDHPHAGFSGALDRIGPAVRSDSAHVEDAADRSGTHYGAVLLAVLAISPGGHRATAALAVGEQGGGQLANPLHIQAAERAAARVGDVASIGADLADGVIP